MLVPPGVFKVIAARSSAETQPVAIRFAMAALSRDAELVEHRSTKAPRYFRVVHGGKTVAYVRPRREALRIEYGIPYLRSGLGFGIDGAFGPSYAFDLADEGGLADAVALLDEAISAATGR